LKTSAIMLRSKRSNILAMFQPPFSCPITLRRGTRASVRKVSQNGDEPLISRMGRTCTPGVAMSISRKVMPPCFCAVSVRTRMNIQSDLSPYEVHTFWPFST
jgi:hypothetical protein